MRCIFASLASKAGIAMAIERNANHGRYCSFPLHLTRGGLSDRSVKQLGVAMRLPDCETDAGAMQAEILTKSPSHYDHTDLSGESALMILPKVVIAAGSGIESKVGGKVCDGVHCRGRERRLRWRIDWRDFSHRVCKSVPRAVPERGPSAVRLRQRRSMPGRITACGAGRGASVDRRIRSSRRRRHSRAAARRGGDTLREEERGGRDTGVPFH
jgi:hypothetical protein